MLESQVSNKGIDSVLQFDLVEVLNDVETTKTINSILFSLCLFKVSMKLTDCRPMAPSPWYPATPSSSSEESCSIMYALHDYMPDNLVNRNTDGFNVVNGINRISSMTYANIDTTN